MTINFLVLGGGILLFFGGMGECQFHAYGRGENFEFRNVHNGALRGVLQKRVLDFIQPFFEGLRMRQGQGQGAPL